MRISLVVEGFAVNAYVDFSSRAPHYLFVEGKRVILLLHKRLKTKNFIYAGLPTLILFKILYWTVWVVDYCFRGYVSYVINKYRRSA